MNMELSMSALIWVLSKAEGIKDLSPGSLFGK